MTAAPVTTSGTIVGTLQYMAPEQLEGKDADARSDIFAFGAVLFEMLIGRRAFDAPSQAGVIASIVSAAPAAVSTIRPDVPGVLDHVVERCLSKAPRDRWQSAADVKFELEWIARGDADSQPATTARSNWLWLSLAATVALLLITSGLLGVLFSGREQDVSVTRFTLDPAHEIAPVAVPVAIARDGSRIAYVNRDVVGEDPARGPDDTGVARRIHVKPLDRFEEQVVSGTDGATSALFSPDGSSLGVVVQGRVKTVQLTGGAAVTIAEKAADFGIEWADDDTIVYTSSETGGLMRVPARGGTAQVLTTPDASRGELRHLYPQVLPGRRAVLFTVSTGLTFDAARVVAVSLDTGRQSTVLEDGLGARYSRSGHVVFRRGTRLYASPFDVSRLAVTAPPTPLLEALRRTARGARACHSRCPMMVTSCMCRPRRRRMKSSGSLGPVRRRESTYRRASILFRCCHRMVVMPR